MQKSIGNTTAYYRINQRNLPRYVDFGGLDGIYNSNYAFHRKPNGKMRLVYSDGCEAGFVIYKGVADGSHRKTEAGTGLCQSVETEDHPERDAYDFRFEVAQAVGDGLGGGVADFVGEDCVYA